MPRRRSGRTRTDHFADDHLWKLPTEHGDRGASLPRLLYLRECGRIHRNAQTKLFLQKKNGAWRDFCLWKVPFRSLQTSPSVEVLGLTSDENPRVIGFDHMDRTVHLYALDEHERGCRLVRSIKIPWVPLSRGIHERKEILVRGDLVVVLIRSVGLFMAYQDKHLFLVLPTVPEHFSIRSVRSVVLANSIADAPNEWSRSLLLAFWHFKPPREITLSWIGETDDYIGTTTTSTVHKRLVDPLYERRVPDGTFVHWICSTADASRFNLISSIRILYGKLFPDVDDSVEFDAAMVDRRVVRIWSHGSKPLVASVDVYTQTFAMHDVVDPRECFLWREHVSHHDDWTSTAPLGAAPRSILKARDAPIELIYE